MILFCTVCKAEIPDKRARRHAITCSDECGRVLNLEKVRDRQKRKCVSCGRRFRPRKQEGASLTQKTAIQIGAQPSESTDFIALRFGKVQ